MTLTQWEKNGWIRPHQTSPVAKLTQVIWKPAASNETRLSTTLPVPQLREMLRNCMISRSSFMLK